jgi:D-3-phosphoglycerate dehydrogenase
LPISAGCGKRYYSKHIILDKVLPLQLRVLICDAIHQDGAKLLREAGYDVVEKPKVTREELLADAKNFNVLVVRGRTKITAEVIAAAPLLKAIARSGVGLDNIDLEAAKKRGITVISTPGAPVTSVAELAIGLMISLLRQIPIADQAMKQAQWTKSQLMGRELHGRTLGVVGAGGRIGAEVARIANQGFGMKVIGYDVVDLTSKAKELGFEISGDLDSLVERADIVTIHVPYLPSTHHLMDSSRIRRMRQGAVLINTSRGDIVDGRALLESLKEGRIGGVGLDVFHDEPPKEDWEKEIVAMKDGRSVCTPHVGAQTQECQRLESVTVAKEIIRLLGG